MCEFCDFAMSAFKREDNTMLEISGKTNLLEQKSYKYSLQDIPDPNLYRDIYPYEAVPKIAFNHRRVPMGMPEEIWITDTSLRDGQQSVEPYTVDQIVQLYKLMSKLGGPYGIIRQTEFFIYSKKDREAVEKCMELGLRFPEITTWIRATKNDFKLVRDMGIRETGILLGREFMVTSLRLIAAGKGVVIAADKWGKVKTISQMVWLNYTLLMLWLFPEAGWAHILVVVLMGIVVATTAPTIC